MQNSIHVLKELVVQLGDKASARSMFIKTTEVVIRRFVSLAKSWCEVKQHRRDSA